MIKKQEPLKIAVISDCQVKSGVDLTYLTAIGNYIASKKPNVIVNIGDFWDFPSFSRMTKASLVLKGADLKRILRSATLVWIYC